MKKTGQKVWDILIGFLTIFTDVQVKKWQLELDKEQQTGSK